MRPPKRVLLIDSNEYEASVIACALKVWGYRVLRATSITDAKRLKAPDVVLAYFPIDAAKAQRVAKAEHVPLIFVCQKHSANPSIIADCVLIDPPRWTLLDKLRILTARKRGPSPGGHWEDVHGRSIYVRTPRAECEVAAL